MKGFKRSTSPGTVMTALVIACIAALPLWAIAVYLWPVAQGDTWAFIRRYMGVQEGRLPWTSLLSSHGPHPGLLLRPITLLPLMFGDGDFSPLTWLSWIAAALCFCFIALLLLRQEKKPPSPQAPPQPSAGLACLLVLAAALVFSMGQGLAWTWEFVWINWVPGACLAALLWLDSRHMHGGSPRISVSGWFARGLLALLAMIAFGNGMFVWVVLTVGWSIRRLLSHPAAPGWRAQLAWGAVFTLLTWMLVLRPAGEGGGGFGALLERPLMSAHYLLCLIGGSFANGTDLAPSIQGAVIGGLIGLLLLGGLCYGFRHRSDTALQDTLLPWFQAALFALLAALLITSGRMHQTVYTAFASRYLTLTFWLPLAAAAITVFCVRHWLTRMQAAAPERSRQWQARLTSSGYLLTGAALSLWVMQSVWGLHDMRWYHREKLTVAAAYQFVRVLPDEMDHALRHISVGRQDSVGFLLDRGQLPGVDPAISAFVTDLRLRADLNDARWSVVPNEGQVRIEGHARMNSRREPPDLILVEVAPGDASDDEPGRIAAMIAPQRPLDFDRRNYHINLAPEYYLGFGDDIPLDFLRLASADVPRASDAPPKALRVRLYAVDQRSRVVRRVAGQHFIPLKHASAN